MHTSTYVRSVSLSIALGAFTLSSEPAGAQRNPSPGDSILGPTDIAPRRNALVTRVGASASGAVAGGIAGLVLGYVFSTEDQRALDGPAGTDPTLAAGIVGAVIGAGVGTAIHGLHSRCGLQTRLGRSLLGASIGGAAAFLLVRGNADDPNVVVGVPVGAIAGSVAAFGRCMKSKL